MLKFVSLALLRSTRNLNFDETKISIVDISPINTAEINRSVTDRL